MDYRSGVQQPLTLSHPSVGYYKIVSHCGFGSMWEGLMSEKQIVLPGLLVEQLGVAVEVKRE